MPPPATEESQDLALLSPALSIRALAEETPSWRISRALHRLSEDLERGRDWRTAVEALRGRLPEYLLGALEAGSRSGRLGRLLTEYLSVVRSNDAVWRRLTASLIYPGLQLFTAAVLILGVLAVVAPGFREIFEDYGVALPTITLWVLGIGQILARLFPWLLGGGLLALLAGYLLIRLPKPLAMAPIVRVVQQIPLLGTAYWHASAAEFCALLAPLINSRIPLPEALRLTASASRDPNLRAGALALATDVEQGRPCSAVARELPHFRSPIPQVMQTEQGEEVFAENLRQHARLLAQQSDAGVRLTLAMIIDPLMPFVVAVGVGLIVIAMFLPIIKLINSLA